MRDKLLRHFRKGMYHGGNRRLRTLISYVLLVVNKVTPLRSCSFTEDGACMGGQTFGQKYLIVQVRLEGNERFAWITCLATQAS